MKCGFCNGAISNEDGEMPIEEKVLVMEPRVWTHEVSALVCPHCTAIFSIETPAKT